MLRHRFFVRPADCLLFTEESFNRTEVLLLEGSTDHLFQLLTNDGEGYLSIAAASVIQVLGCLCKSIETD